MINFRTPRQHLISIAIGGVCGILLTIAAVFSDLLPGSIIYFIFPGALLLSLTGYWLSNMVRRFLPSAPQLLRFALVGALSTSIELAILNILFALTGITSGIYFSIFKALTFIIALGNGYFFNKNWTFPKTENSIGREFGKYVIVNIVGLILNVGTATLVVNVVGTPSGISSTTWANMGAIVAVFIVMIWNFLSYKCFVFRKQDLYFTQNK